MHGGGLRGVLENYSSREGMPFTYVHVKDLGELGSLN